MIGIRVAATTVRITCATAAELLAAVHANVLATSLLGGALLLISILALTAGLSKKKERRDAAYKVLKLILYTIRRPVSLLCTFQQIRPGPDPVDVLRRHEPTSASAQRR
jgi:hypothetical protein